MTQQELIGLFLGFIWKLVRDWWWLVLPFLLQAPFKYLWRWWKVEHWLKTVYKPVLLEIRIPKESEKPIRAMESVMASIHGSVYHPPDWWETWIDGQAQTSVSFEIASFGGEIHFYLRVDQSYRGAVEASIYSQYPDAEIFEVEDYTKKIPQDIPNKEWDLWATDYTLLKENPYPIRTYKDFEKEILEEPESKVDPVAALLEGLSKVKPGEQFWIQIMAEPTTNVEIPWVTQGEELRDKLAKRPQKTGTSTKPMVLEATEILLKGMPEPEPEKPQDLIPPEMRLTPGERDIVAAIENKISKPGFKTTIRFIFLGKRDVWFKANFRLGFAFFASFATQNFNWLIPWGVTISKVKKSRFVPLNKLIPRRLHLRKRKLFRLYTGRNAPLFPRAPGKGKGRAEGQFILNTEELASLYHFPSWRTAPVPGVSRVEARRKAPPALPTEE
jgi:hypothetical protein